MRPPIYSLTFAHPQEENESETNPLTGLSKEHNFSSID